MRRRGLERAAILAVLVGPAAACEAIVGITDRQLGTQDGSSGGDDVTTQNGTDGASAAQQDGALQDGAQQAVDGGAGGDATIGTPGPDADAQPGVEVSTVDADAGTTTDAPGTDGFVPDAGADAPDAAPVDPDVPCSMQPTFRFCEDWDLATSAAQHFDWNYTAPDGGGVMQLETTNVRSMPNALQVIAPVLTGGIQAVQLAKIPSSLGTFNTSMRLAFDIRVDVATYTTLPQTGVAQLILARPAAGNLQINFNLGPGSFANLNSFIADGGSPAITATVPALQTWTRIAVAYDSSGAVSLYQNGQFVGAQSTGASAPGPVTVIIGAVYVNPSGTETMKFEMDNVVVTGQ